MCTFYFYNNFGKCEPVLIILSLSHFPMEKICHLTSNLLPHYLAKIESSTAQLFKLFIHISLWVPLTSFNISAIFCDIVNKAFCTAIKRARYIWQWVTFYVPRDPQATDPWPCYPSRSVDSFEPWDTDPVSALVHIFMDQDHSAYLTCSTFAIVSFVHNIYNYCNYFLSFNTKC